MRSEVEQALAILQKDEPGSVDRALRLLQKEIFSFSMKLCGRREDAEDTMQETLLKTVSHLSQFSNPKALGVWLYKVAKSQCLMSRRKSKFAPKEELSIEVLMPDQREFEGHTRQDFPAPERALLRKERSQQLRKAILKLPPSFRLILVLHDMEELSTEEVARVTGLREGTVRVRLHRARLFLRKELNAPAADGKAAAGTRPAPTARCRRLFGELSGYLEGTIDPARCRQLEEHLADCPSCRAFVKSLEETVALVRGENPPPVDSPAAGRIRARLSAQYRRAVEESGTPRRAREKKL